jgi:antitoxin (DNA-binding transcriptional repressor) of toxin-antitoxin stability system
MTTMGWLELPEVADEVLDRVNDSGGVVIIRRNGRPNVRIEPVDAATLAEFNVRRSAR